MHIMGDETKELAELIGPNPRELKLGRSFQKTKAANSKSYDTIKYDSKPPYLDQELDIHIGSNDSVELFEKNDTSGQALYKGSRKRAGKEHILFVDHQTGEITWEKVGYHITVKQTRKNTSKNNHNSAPSRKSQSGMEKSEKNPKQGDRHSKTSSSQPGGSGVMTGGGSPGGSQLNRMSASQPPPTSSARNEKKKETKKPKKPKKPKTKSKSHIPIASLSSSSSSSSSSSASESDSDTDLEEVHDNSSNQITSDIHQKSQNGMGKGTHPRQLHQLSEDLRLSDSGSESDY